MENIIIIVLLAIVAFFIIQFVLIKVASKIVRGILKTVIYVGLPIAIATYIYTFFNV